MTKPVERDERGCWKKGSSGNPKGKTRELPADFLDDFQKGAPKALRIIKELMSSKDENIRLQATKYYLDKCVGTKFQAYLDTDPEQEELTIRVIPASDKDENRR